MYRERFRQDVKLIDISPVIRLEIKKDIISVLQLSNNKWEELYCYTSNDIEVDVENEIEELRLL